MRLRLPKNELGLTYEEFLAQLPAYSEYINEEMPVLVVIDQHNGWLRKARVIGIDLVNGRIDIRVALNL